MSERRPTVDPEAEQEIDFGRYVRLIAARWWLVVAGLILGAVVGYAVSVGTTQGYQATATLYLGQPYSASGNVQLAAAQTNPGTVGQIVHARSVDNLVAAACKTKPGTFRNGISSAAVTANPSKNAQSSLVTVTVQTARRKIATCAANGLARVVIAKTSRFADQKVATFSAQIVNDNAQIAEINQALQSSNTSPTDKLVLQLRLGTLEDARLSTTQLQLQARQVEKPSVLTAAAASQVTGRSHRNTAVVAAIIGAILGAILALFWDRIAAAAQRRRAP
jgi:uncharacterized protein involved in exopolysaccharide biosynthesis